MKELVVNIWIYIDLETEMAYNWSGKVYSIEGSEEEKFAILKKLSSTDYQTAPRHPFPENIKAILGNMEMNGYLPSNAVKSFFDVYPDLFFDELDKTLPPLLNLDISNLGSSFQKIPDDPLYVLTQIFEDENGKLHTIITKEDVDWLERERFKHRGNLFF